MRIALLTDGIWPYVVGGMQKHSYYLCKYFAQNKIYVELFHPEDEIYDINYLFSEEEKSYINVWFVPKPIHDKYPGHYIRACYKYSENVYHKLDNVLKEKSDIKFIYAKGLTSWFLLKKRKELKFYLPIAINVHGYEYFQKTASIKHQLEQYLLRPAFKFINESSDFIFSYGGKISDIIIDNIKNSASKIIEIPTGIESEFLIDRIAPCEGQRKFVFIGRNERRKGVIELNSAIISLLKSSDFEFHFIGDIPIDKRIISDNIFYHGILKDRESITRILQKSDVLVCPSYAEGMPNVILEGMSSGCAIIASDVGAVNIQVDKENGWLIKPGSISSLTEAMEEAIKISSINLNKLRACSLNKVKSRFLWKNVIEMKIEAIQKIISTESND